MRFMMLVKASKESEAGEMPSAELIDAMIKFNEEMAKAGVMQAGEGLHPSSKGTRIKFEGGKRTVTRGPFANTAELLAGFWLIDVKSEEEAFQWASKIPFTDGETVEIRKIFETEEFEGVMSPEAMAREKKLQKELEEKQAKKR
ncbi:MAG TPA: YciI family protein [Methylomirabilota bacterium]|nr:YciI family protein [Methylomirabilota bacterium]